MNILSDFSHNYKFCIEYNLFVTSIILIRWKISVLSLFKSLEN